MNYENMLQDLMIMARADGELDAKELQLLQRRRAEWEISEAKFDELLKATESPDAELKVPESPAHRYDLLADMALMMAADGRFDDLEMRMLAIAAVRFEISADQLDEILSDFSDDEDDLILGD